jgi:molybdenum cofactor biosynthesis protein MoaC
MIDITHKSNTQRYARTQAVVRFGSPLTAIAIRERKVPKGDVMEAARAAALFAVKRTSDMIPDCHPLPVEYANVRYELSDDSLRIEMEVKTVYKTGVEVEAMHGVSVAALTVYDMLKPIDSDLEISSIRLLEKKGGKSDFPAEFLERLNASVIVCSDSISSGKKEDRAGKAIIERLERMHVKVAEYTIIPDEKEMIQAKLRSLVAAGHQLVIFTGGTGLSRRDVTPEAIRPLLEREVPGIEETIRRYGQDRMPYSMLSRSVAGMIGETLVLGLPGSTRGAGESMDAVFPHVLHLFRVLEALRHEEDGM